MNDSPSNARDGCQPKNMPARHILDALSPRLRLDPNVIQPTGDLVWHGGSTEVVVANLVSLGDEFVTQDLGVKVAVKKLHFITGKERDRFLNSFANEVLILSELSHLNIIELIGFVEDETNDIAWIVLPWEANGNLRDFVLSRELEIPQRISLIKDVMSGIEHLHTRQPPIYHGDLKSLNILIDSECCAILTDFGSARVLKGRTVGDSDDTRTIPESPAEPTLPGEDQASPQVTYCATAATLTLTGPHYTLRWAAPEVLLKSSFDLPSDIWAFGWICWEVMTGSVPFPALETRFHVTMTIIEGTLPAIREEDQMSQILTLCSLMNECWRHEPEERASAVRCDALLTWMPSSVPPRVPEERAPGNRSVDLLGQLGEMHRKQGRLDEALSLFQEAVEGARLTHQSRALGAALLGVGDIHRARSNNLEAESNYNQALEVFNQIDGAKGLRANALDRLGEAYRAQMKFTEAEECYSQALEIYTDLGVDAGRANVSDGLGDLYMLQCRYTEAYDSYAEELEICTRIGDELGTANALYGMGEIHAARSETSEAERRYAQAMEVYERIGDALGRANILLCLGNIHNSRSESSKAEACFAEAVEISTHAGYELGKETALLSLGRLHLARSDREKARTCFMQSRDVSSKIGNERGEELARVLLERVEGSERRSVSPSPLFRLESSPYIGGQGPPHEVKPLTLFGIGIGTVVMLFRSLDTLMPFLCPV